MRTLLENEWRDLRVGLLAALGAAVVLALIHLAYYLPQARGEDQFAPNVWAVLSFVIAFLGGGGVFARDSRQSTVFLNSWPYSRATLWTARTLVAGALVFAAIAAGFIISAGAASVTDSHGLEAWGKAQTYSALGHMLLLCFAFALLWSTLAGPTLAAAALGLVTVFALIVAYAGLFGGYLPGLWGAMFAGIEGGRLLPSLVSGGTFWRVSTTALALAAVATSGYAFVRYPVLETRRRLKLAMAALAALLVAVTLGIAIWQFFREPPLEANFREPKLAGDWIVFGTKAWGPYWDRSVGSRPPQEGSPDNMGGVWSVPVAGGRARLLAKGTPRFECPNWSSVLLRYRGFQLWAVNAATGSRRRIERVRDITFSPDGHYMVIGRPGSLIFTDTIWHKGRPVAEIPYMADPAFSADSRYVYYKDEGYIDRTRGSYIPMLVISRLDLQTGLAQTVAALREAPVAMEVSADGRYLAVEQSVDTPQPCALRPALLAVVDLQTGRSVSFAGLSLASDSENKVRFGETSGRPPLLRKFLDNRHLVCWRRASGTLESTGLEFVDVVVGRVIRTVPVSAFGPDGSPEILAQPGAPYAIVHVGLQPKEPRPAGRTYRLQPREPAPRRYRLWRVDLDGSGLQQLQEGTGEVVGMTSEGRVIIFDGRRTLWSYSPQTGGQNSISVRNH